MDKLQGHQQQQETIAGIDWNKNIQTGDNGDAVTDYQEKLKQLGYYPGKIDGIFGTVTVTATKDFQHDYQLQVDGIIGPITKQKIAEILSSDAILQYGSSLVEVKTLQRQLKTQQLYQEGKIDGIFGPLTDGAVKKFQTDNGLIEDGKVGAKTKAALKKILLKDGPDTRDAEVTQDADGNQNIFETIVSNVGKAIANLTDDTVEADREESAANKGQAPAAVPADQTGRVYITAEQLQTLGWVNIDDAMLKDLNNCLERYQINQTRRMRHFISQCSVESGYGQFKTEQSWQTGKAAGAQYEGRADLGNTHPGDGPKYKGAGYLQLTGRKNYQSFADNVNDHQIMEGAEYVAQKYPWTSAGFFWNRDQFNALCDQDASVEAISKKVNCGSEKSKCHPNGLSEREAAFKKCTAIIK